jgi:GrpB-like predicted nucleotidyltransferase (UPF0157 family)
VLFLPLDSRPATRDAVIDLARAAGVNLRSPDRAVLGDRERGADVRAIWSWIHMQLDSAEVPAACIASVEMLCFGGLVASRTSPRHWRNILPWLDEVHALAARVPTYLSAVIPRAPLQGGSGEDPDYWEAYGEVLRQYALAADQFGWMGDAVTGRRVAEALERLPAAVIEAVLQHRRRHLLINTELLIAAARGPLRALLIAQDDTTTTGFSGMDREVLERLSRPLQAANVLLMTGADELGAVLFARWLNESTAAAPAVRIVYTFPNATDRVPSYESTPLAQTVREHLHAAGCRVVESGEDILLWVHNFEGDRQQEARDQDEEAFHLDRVEAILPELREAGREERVLALADVRFANGADGRLVERLLEEPRFAGIVAYAGWNTASNSLGSAIAQAVTVFHMRQSTVPADDRAAWRMLFARLLDDWGYQVVVRPRLTALAQDRGGNPYTLGALEGKLEEAALRMFEEAVVPQLAQGFRLAPAVLRVTFPWHRLFETAIDYEVPGRASPPRRGRVVVEAYNPQWPALFEEDRVQILSAVGELAVAVEHIGSTAVDGLAAKPIVDIAVGVRAVDDLDRCIGPLQRLGYEYEPAYEVSLPNRRYFRKNDAQGRRTHHMHVVVYGSTFWQRHTLFRDYLRAHPEKAREYAELKKGLAAEYESTADYTYAKTAFIQSVERITVDEAARRMTKAGGQA